MKPAASSPIASPPAPEHISRTVSFVSSFISNPSFYLPHYIMIFYILYLNLVSCATNSLIDINLPSHYNYGKPSMHLICSEGNLCHAAQIHAAMPIIHLELLS